MKKIFTSICLLLQVMLYSQSDFPYKQPPQTILDLANAKPAPGLRINRDATIGLLLSRDAYKSMEELSAPEIKLGGLRINPAINGPSRVTYINNVQLLEINSGKEKNITGLPEKAKMGNFAWSNDQKWVAFTNVSDTGIEIWVIDIVKAHAKKLTNPIVNANISNIMAWAKDDKSVVFTSMPSKKQSLIDTKNTIPSGPIIAENDGQKAQNRTYQDLIKNQYDEKNFEILSTSELSRVTLEGKVSKMCEAAMYSGFAFSPDGNFILTYEIKRPFSYLVTYGSFPMDINILDKNGKLIKNFAKIPLQEELPKGFMAVRKGPRAVQWRSDKPATLVWVDAQDGGDPAVEVPHRDFVYEQEMPFIGSPSLLVKTKLRYAGISWGNDKTAMVYERWWNTRLERSLFFDPSDSELEPRLLNERNSQDQYADPGDIVSKTTDYNTQVIDIVDGKFYLIGEGFTPQGKFPFIDEYSLSDFGKKRIFQATDTEKLEDILSALDTQKGQYITRIESKNEYPNIYIRNIKDNTIKALTNNPNPFKILSDVHKEVIKYKRPDGVELSATLYLPVGYDKAKKDKLPMIMWAYPTEFKDKNSASQITANANEFTFPNYGSPIYWLAQGYAILDDASFPIVGEGKNEPNDTFIPQLVANAKAAIDAVDDLGYIDRNKVAVGGHSYGAFMVANLLTHSDLFAAGIARSGAYNRTLTPFGFQSEERNYWEAPEVYDAMSPFQNADKMKHPMLIIHGEEDNNPGTFPIQSERYFNALKGLGATARYVVLPKESHGYAAKESIMHMLWEQDQWLEKYVKNRQPNTDKPKSEKP